MKNFYFLNIRITPILITIMMALTISACSTDEDTTVATTAYVNSETNDDANNVDETNTAANIGLSWVAPVAREDNAPIALSEIAGYKIYYGTTQGQYPHSLTINDGTATGYTFNSFATATYYFVLTTIDTEGRESQYSPEIAIVT
jgi:hypothetical protein